MGNRKIYNDSIALDLDKIEDIDNGWISRVYQICFSDIELTCIYMYTFHFNNYIQNVLVGKKIPVAMIEEHKNYYKLLCDIKPSPGEEILLENNIYMDDYKYKISEFDKCFKAILGEKFWKLSNEDFLEKLLQVSRDIIIPNLINVANIISIDAPRSKDIIIYRGTYGNLEENPVVLENLGKTFVSFSYDLNEALKFGLLVKNNSGITEGDLIIFEINLSPEVKVFITEVFTRVFESEIVTIPQKNLIFELKEIEDVVYVGDSDFEEESSKKIRFVKGRISISRN